MAAEGARDFVAVAFFDRNLRTIGKFRVERGTRCGHVKRHAVVLGQNREAVRADLIRGVAVGGDAVGSDNAGAHFFQAQDARGHVVANHRHGHAGAAEFPGRQARALPERARFVGKDVDLDAFCCAAYTTAKAVPEPAVASAPALQWVMMVAAGPLNNSAP